MSDEQNTQPQDQVQAPAEQAAPSEQPQATQTDTTAAAQNVEKAVDEAIAEAPAKANWAVEVAWTEGSTEDERKAAFDSIADFVKDAATSPAEHLPAAIQAVTIKRI